MIGFSFRITNCSCDPKWRSPGYQIEAGYETGLGVGSLESGVWSRGSGIQFRPGTFATCVLHFCSSVGISFGLFSSFSAKRCQCGKCFVLNIFMAAISWSECGKCCSHCQCHCHWPEATDRRPNLRQLEPDRVLTLEVSVSLAKCFRKNAKRSQLMPFTRRLASQGTYIYVALLSKEEEAEASLYLPQLLVACIGFPSSYPGRASGAICLVAAAL